MKISIFASAICIFLLTACSELSYQDISAESGKITDPSEHNMKFIPQNPGINDQVSLVVYDDCTYNTLFGITKNGFRIDIEKRFNGMMKWPCMIRNDTILIGKLAEGAYTINYKLVDIATPETPKISLSFTYSLIVSR
jgi:hypothetical protein